jgi:hypothetical protein
MMYAFFVVFVMVSAAQASPPQPSETASTIHGRALQDQAQREAERGWFLLECGQFSEAQTTCDAAVKLDDRNQTARGCLRSATSKLIDQDLIAADTKLHIGDRAGAVAIAYKWKYPPASEDQQERAKSIVRRARFWPRLDAFVPGWLQDVFTVLVLLTAGALLLLAIRRGLIAWQRYRWSSSAVKMRWSMLPLQEIPAASGVATDVVLDALTRLGRELERPIWQPKLLLLRPTPPANHEPSLISDFLSSELKSLTLAPGLEHLGLRTKLPDVELDQAIQNLQLKTAAGIDVGSVARFLRSIVTWFKAGQPQISGICESTDQAVSIHLTAQGMPGHCGAITASTRVAEGLDCLQLSAERAAFKFLLRMRFESETTDAIDGFSALRQGATQFAEYADTVQGSGDSAKQRKSALAKAAFDLGFVRTSIPRHCEEALGLCRTIDDDVRQSILLAEGVAHAMVGNDEHTDAAIDCFRQLEDWPGSQESEILRQQATYNEAILWWREHNYPGRCALMLTDLLGEKFPDTQMPESNVATHDQRESSLPESIRLLAILARLSALATYSRDDWSVLPQDRSDLVLKDSEDLIRRLCRLIGENATWITKHTRAATNCTPQRGESANEQISAHDRRIARYMFTEALRAYGHVKLMSFIVGCGAKFYEAKRPTRHSNAKLDEQEASFLQDAIDHMLSCETQGPNCELYCDLAEGYLLRALSMSSAGTQDSSILGSLFETAEGYARHATLEANIGTASYERAYYLATETNFLEGTEKAKAKAKRYAESFKGTVTLEEFKSVRNDLGILKVPTDPLPENTATQACVARTNS